MPLSSTRNEPSWALVPRATCAGPVGAAAAEVAPVTGTVVAAEAGAEVGGMAVAAADASVAGTAVAATCGAQALARMVSANKIASIGYLRGIFSLLDTDNMG